MLRKHIIKKEDDQSLVDFIRANPREFNLILRSLENEAADLAVKGLSAEGLEKKSMASGGFQALKKYHDFISALLESPPAT